MAAPSATAGELRDRLGGLTLRDEHRLGRRLDRVRATKDPEARGRALTRWRARSSRPRRASSAGAPPCPRSATRRSCRSARAATTCSRRSATTRSSSSPARPARARPRSCRRSASSSGAACAAAIAHTQPRRLAARTVAERIADELDVDLGEAVGYAVRFSDRSREDTLVRLMTDGLLLAEIQHDRLLRRYDTIIVDEAHERSLNIDFLLGYLQAAAAAAARPQGHHHLGDDRPRSASPRTSATRRSSRSPGRTYPVEVRYRPLAVDDRGRRPRPAPTTRSTRSATPSTSSCARAPGRHPRLPLRRARDPRHRRRAARAPARRRRGPAALRAPVHRRAAARLREPHAEPPRRARHQRRRDVADRARASATSSIPGTARISRYSARLKVQRLPIEPISQASADQRKGRCGRTSRRHLHPALLRGGLRRAPALHRPRDPAHQPRRGDPADGGARPRRRRGLPVPRPARPPPGARRHQPAARARRARPTAEAARPLTAARAPARAAAGRPAAWAGWCSRPTGSAAPTR